MDNRFLFRGKREDYGYWIMGYIDVDNGYKNKVFIYSLESGHCMVEESTVGQCTGLIAAKSYRGESDNDKLVFEGDIIRIIGKKCSIATVCFGNRHRKFGFIVKYLNGTAWDDLDNIDDHSEIEIIGNIHEHPELLSAGAQN